MVEKGIDTVLLAVQSSDSSQMRRINSVLRELDVTAKIIPTLMGSVDEAPAISPVADSSFFDSFMQADTKPRSGNSVDRLTREIPLIRPTLPDIHQVFETVSESYKTGQVTCGSVVSTFEEEFSRFTQTEHAVAVASCTSGLILIFTALELKAGSEIIVPSFTFAATVHALYWNQLVPVYVDCLPGTMTIDPDEVRKALSRKTAAIYPVNVFGLPPDYRELTDISEHHGVPLVCDSAQGLGSNYQDTPTGGFGLVEAFSLSPGKVVTAMEGGIVTTNDPDLADKLRSLRQYGKGPDGQEMTRKGLSARMVEFDAAVGLLNLRRAEDLVKDRQRLVAKYRERFDKAVGMQVTGVSR